MQSKHTHTVLHDHEANTQDLLEREWLLTNGVGGFAMGTALGVNTRRYHGLLVAATQPPVGRVVVLNQLFEQLELTRDGKTHLLEFGGCLFANEGNPIIAPDSMAGKSAAPGAAACAMAGLIVAEGVWT